MVIIIRMHFEIEQEHELDYQLYSLITNLHIKTKRKYSLIILLYRIKYIFIP
jgi:hypothetical protein